MPKPISNAFTEFEFTEAEWYVATRFTPEQLMMLQTLLAKAAMKRINVKIDPDDKSSLQEEAALKGEMSAYEYLLTLYSDTEVPELENEHKPVTGINSSVQPAQSTTDIKGS